MSKKAFRSEDNLKRFIDFNSLIDGENFYEIQDQGKGKVVEVKGKTLDNFIEAIKNSSLNVRGGFIDKVKRFKGNYTPDSKEIVDLINNLEAKQRDETAVPNEIVEKAKKINGGGTISTEEVDKLVGKEEEEEEEEIGSVSETDKIIEEMDALITPKKASQKEPPTPFYTPEKNDPISEENTIPEENINLADTFMATAETDVENEKLINEAKAQNEADAANVALTAKTKAEDEQMQEQQKTEEELAKQVGPNQGAGIKIKRYHPIPLLFYFSRIDSNIEWDTELYSNIMDCELSKEEIINFMENIIESVGKKIQVRVRKSETKEELNELQQLAFCLFRNLQKGTRYKTASVKVSDIIGLTNNAVEANSSPSYFFPKPTRAKKAAPVDLEGIRIRTNVGSELTSAKKTKINFNYFEE